MASTHVNHNIYITEVKTGKCVHSLVGHRRTPWCVTFHPTIPGLIASGCLDGEVRIWDLHVSLFLKLMCLWYLVGGDFFCRSLFPKCCLVRELFASFAGTCLEKLRTDHSHPLLSKEEVTDSSFSPTRWVMLLCRVCLFDWSDTDNAVELCARCLFSLRERCAIFHSTEHI